MILNAKLLESDNQVLNVRSTTYKQLELGRDNQSNPNMNFLNQMKGIAAPILRGGQTVFFSVWNNLTIELLHVSK